MRPYRASGPAMKATTPHGFGCLHIEMSQLRKDHTDPGSPASYTSNLSLYRAQQYLITSTNIIQSPRAKYPNSRALYNTTPWPLLCHIQIQLHSITRKIKFHAQSKLCSLPYCHHCENRFVRQQPISRYIARKGAAQVVFYKSPA